MGSFERTHQRHTEQFGVLPMADNRVQIKLAKIAFEQKYKQAPQNGNEAMQLWDQNFAAHYRDYVTDPQHAAELIDTSNTEELKRVLDAIEGYEQDLGRTLH